MDTIPDFRNNVSTNPHVVILGAGASLAAFPNGDKYGRKLPLMNSLVSTLGLTDMFSKNYEPLLNDFEKLYSTICEDKSKTVLRKTIEDSVSKYFYEMQVSDTPTLYDYLILSLREKDVIATFNWDPLLLQCFRRHSKYQKHLPQVLFLHGNVAVGVCRSCNILGYKYNLTCHHCNKGFTSMPLLYPVASKDYSKDNYIREQWDQLRYILKYAYYITIFGYSAPTSDTDAKDLMLHAIKQNTARVFSEIDIIDLKSEDEIEDTWNDFFYSHHYGVDRGFEDNYLWYHPRKSCEALASATLMNQPLDDNPFPKFDNISAMHEWLDNILDDEIRATN